jgi:hypothetical protein
MESPKLTTTITDAHGYTIYYTEGMRRFLRYDDDRTERFQVELLAALRPELEQIDPSEEHCSWNPSAKDIGEFIVTYRPQTREFLIGLANEIDESSYVGSINSMPNEPSSGGMVH